MSKRKTDPVKQNQPLRLSDEAAQAIADYQRYMLTEQNVMVSINKSINALIVNGWQHISTAQYAPREATK